MKRFSFYLAFNLCALAIVHSCSKSPEIIDPVVDDQPEVEEPLPGIFTEYLVAPPKGDTLEFDLDLDVEQEWEIVRSDSSDWVTLDITTGKGPELLAFVVSTNYEDQERAIAFSVMVEQEEVLKIVLSQPKRKFPIHDGDMEFLKHIVDTKGYGDNTPEITDWYDFNGEGFPYILFDTDTEGRFYIREISFRGSSTDPSENFFSSFPSTVNLQNCESIYVNCTNDGTEPSTMTGWVKSSLRGSEFPTEWNCPKLWRLHLECVGMQGVISPSLAALPVLEQLFIRCCDVYGALPHDWASPVLCNLIIGYGGSGSDCPNMGYLVPAQFDIILNSSLTLTAGERRRDKGGIHLAGSYANWLGYEEGWGQERYEKFDPDAQIGNLSEWSSYRGLTSEDNPSQVEAGGLRNPTGSDNSWYIDSWPWYYQRMSNQPKEMLRWSQSDADAYTEEARARERLFAK